MRARIRQLDTEFQAALEELLEILLTAWDKKPIYPFYRCHPISLTFILNAHITAKEEAVVILRNMKTGKEIQLDNNSARPLGFGRERLIKPIKSLIKGLRESSGDMLEIKAAILQRRQQSQGRSNPI